MPDRAAVAARWRSRRRPSWCWPMTAPRTASRSSSWPGPFSTCRTWKPTAPVRQVLGICIDFHYTERLWHRGTKNNVVSEFLNPIPRDELMEESGLFSLQMEDPFANLANTCSAQPPANHHIQVQVVVANSTTERFSFGRRHRRHGLSFFFVSARSTGEQREPDGGRGSDVRPVPALGDGHEHALRRRLPTVLLVRDFMKHPPRRRPPLRPLPPRSSTPPRDLPSPPSSPSSSAHWSVVTSPPVAAPFWMTSLSANEPPPSSSTPSAHWFVTTSPPVAAPFRMTSLSANERSQKRRH